MGPSERSKVVQRPKPAERVTTETPNSLPTAKAGLEILSSLKPVRAAANNGSVQKIIEDALRSAGLMR